MPAFPRSASFCIERISCIAMVFFAGANIFSRSTVPSRGTTPKAVPLNYVSVHAPRPVALYCDQEHLEVFMPRMLPRSLRSIGAGNADGSALHAPPYTMPFAPQLRPLAPQRSHTPPVAVVTPIRRDDSDCDSTTDSPTSTPVEPPYYLANAVNNLDLALKYIAGLGETFPDRNARVLALEIVQYHLTVPQFRVLRDEMLSSSIWRDAPCLLPVGESKRRFSLRTVLMSDGDYGVRFESILDCRDARSETDFDPDASDVVETASHSFRPAPSEPPGHLIDAISNLNQALRHSSGISGTRPDRDARLSGLEIVQPSLSVSQFRAIRFEVLSAPHWHSDGPRLLPAGQPIRRICLRIAQMDGGDYGARLENIVDYGEPQQSLN